MDYSYRDNLVNLYTHSIIIIKVYNSIKCGINIKIEYIRYISCLSLKTSLYLLIVQYQRKYWVASSYTIRSPHLNFIPDLSRYFVFSNRLPTSHVIIHSPIYHIIYVHILSYKNGKTRPSHILIVRCCVHIHKKYLWVGSMFVQRWQYCQ